MSEFRKFLEAAAKGYPTKRAFAKAIGITPGRLSRILGGEHSLDVLNCLTLARLTGESPSRVLRVAEKHDIADAIDGLYGPAAKAVSPREREHLDAWNALSEGARENLASLMRELPRARPGEVQRADKKRRHSASTEETALKKRGRSG